MDKSNNEKINAVLQYALCDKSKLLEYISFSSMEIVKFGADLNSFLFATKPISIEKYNMSKKYFDMVERLVNKLEELGLIDN